MAFASWLSIFAGLFSGVICFFGLSSIVGSLKVHVLFFGFRYHTFCLVDDWLCLWGRAVFFGGGRRLLVPGVKVSKTSHCRWLCFFQVDLKRLDGRRSVSTSMVGVLVFLG